MQTMQTKIQTKTIVAVALVALAIAGTAAGLVLTQTHKPSIPGVPASSASKCKGYCDEKVYTCVKKTGIDLMFVGGGTSFGGEGIMSNGKPFYVSTEVKNNGTEDAGPFTVKIWKSADKIPGNVEQDTSGNEFETTVAKQIVNIQDYLLATWDIEGLKAGESISKKFENLSYSGFPIHRWYNYIIEIDAGNKVVELNESNNMIAIPRPQNR